MRRSIASIATVLMLSGQFRAEAQEHQVTFVLRGAYTTTSKIYTNPDSPSADLRGQYTGIDNIYAPGFELRWMIPGNSIAVSLAAEYISKFDEEMEFVGFLNPPRALPVKEGLRLVPIELGALVFIPLGSEKVRLTMGGGLGMYVGERIGAKALTERLLARLREHAQDLGSAAELDGIEDLLRRGTGATRQMVVYEANHDFREVMKEIVEATAAP